MARGPKRTENVVCPFIALAGARIADSNRKFTRALDVNKCLTSIEGDDTTMTLLFEKVG